MNNVNHQSLYALFQEVGHAFLRMARFGQRTLRRLSWPALLLACLLLSLILAALPLALLLFAGLLLVKLALGACLLGRRGAPDGRRP